MLLRRPEAEEMETLRVRDVRPLVEIGQEEVCLLMLQRPLRLLWRWRSGGCLGPAAAAEMNERQRLHRLDRPEASPVLDRGSTGGWHLDLVCPCCFRPCRVLFAPRWSQGLRPTSRLWACRQCHRVTYRSCNMPGSWKGQRPHSHAFRKHLEEAVRIRRDLMGLPPDEAERLDAFPSHWWLSVKPRGVRMTWERWEALRTLAVCHEGLAEEAHFGHCLLFSEAMGLQGPGERLHRLRDAYIRSLREQLAPAGEAPRRPTTEGTGQIGDVLRRSWISELAQLQPPALAAGDGALSAPIENPYRGKVRQSATGSSTGTPPRLRKCGPLAPKLAIPWPSLHPRRCRVASRSPLLVLGRCCRQ